MMSSSALKGKHFVVKSLQNLNLFVFYLRSKYCEPMDLPQEEYEFEKEEL